MPPPHACWGVGEEIRPRPTRTTKLGFRKLNSDLFSRIDQSAATAGKTCPGRSQKNGPGASRSTLGRTAEHRVDFTLKGVGQPLLLVGEAVGR
jgi:hypothetical protein